MADADRCKRSRVLRSFPGTTCAIFAARQALRSCSVLLRDRRGDPCLFCVRLAPGAQDPGPKLGQTQPMRDPPDARRYAADGRSTVSAVCIRERPMLPALKWPDGRNSRRMRSVSLQIGKPYGLGLRDMIL